MSWVTRVRNAMPFHRQARNGRESLAQVQGLQRDGFHSRSSRRTSRSVPNATIMAASVQRPALPPCSMTTATTVLTPPVVGEDPLKFKDTKKYTDRIKAARAATGETDAMHERKRRDRRPDRHRRQRAGFRLHGRIDGHGRGRGFVDAVKAAINAKCPYIIFHGIGRRAHAGRHFKSDANAADDGCAVQMLHDAGLPYIVVLTDPTSGGVMASYAIAGRHPYRRTGCDIGLCRTAA